MKELSLVGFVGLLTTLQHEMHEANHSALENAALIVEAEAKRVIGTYHYNWTPLAPSTLAKKAADTPLFETGEMRDSIEHVSDDKEACIGSNNEKALWHELGTHKIPPRSFLMGALQHKADEVVEQIGRGIEGALIGEKVVIGNILRRI